MAYLLTPILRAVRIIRHAISPRLAMMILSNGFIEEEEIVDNDIDVPVLMGPHPSCCRPKLHEALIDWAMAKGKRQTEAMSRRA